MTTRQVYPPSQGARILASVLKMINYTADRKIESWDGGGRGVGGVVIEIHAWEQEQKARGNGSETKARERPDIDTSTVYTTPPPPHPALPTYFHVYFIKYNLQ
jgi:hypothetical protein